MICGSVDPVSKRVCHQQDGHTGEHYDPMYRSQWGNHVKLSSREVQILVCTGRGMSTEETAQSVGLSTWTVKTHKARIMKKLDANNMTHAVVIALKDGELHIGDM